MTNAYRVGASLLTVLTLTTPAFAHSGRTNAQGCHAGSQPYHCHNSGSLSQLRPSARAQQLWRLPSEL